MLESFKLHQNFYCCRCTFGVKQSEVSNYIKISTVVDPLGNVSGNRVSNYIKISTVVDTRKTVKDQTFQITSKFLLL